MNIGYYHEALDRLHVTMCTINDHILEHPGVVEAGVDEDVDKALGHLMKAYQKVGEVAFDAEEE